MFDSEKTDLKELQEFLDYKFRNESILKNALTTPQLGKILNIPDYETLEILGDAVIKLLLISKKIKEGTKDPGEITIIKQCIENDETLSKISNDYFNLKKYVFKTPKQIIEDSKRIMADILEALCGAIFLDSFDLKQVEEKIINKFYNDWEKIIENSPILNKSKLLEYVQKKYRITPVIKVDFENKGPDHAPVWIAKNPKILDKNDSILIPIKKDLKSRECKSKKDAEQDLYLKILETLTKNAE